MDDKKNGSGVLRYDNGDVYEGQWKNNQRNGKGIYHYKNGDVFEGEFKDDKKVAGLGILKSNANKFTIRAYK